MGDSVNVWREESVSVCEGGRVWVCVDITSGDML